MPGNSRAIVTNAERRFPVRIAIKVPPGGIGQRYTPMMAWLDDNCGVDGWSIAPAGVRGVFNDAGGGLPQQPDLCRRLCGPLVCSR
jgi:hypothetical protein